MPSPFFIEFALKQLNLNRINDSLSDKTIIVIAQPPKAEKTNMLAPKCIMIFFRNKTPAKSSIWVSTFCNVKPEEQLALK